MRKEEIAFFKYWQARLRERSIPDPHKGMAQAELYELMEQAFNAGRALERLLTDDRVSA